MALTSDDPDDQGPVAGVEPGRFDPVRFAVHLALAIYLMPVFLLVTSIGAASALAGEVARRARRGPSGRTGPAPKLVDARRPLRPVNGGTSLSNSAPSHPRP